MSESKYTPFIVTAANTPPIVAGSAYTYAYAAGVGTFDTITFTTGTIASVAAGDIVTDLSSGATALIATVDGGGSFTCNHTTTLATPFNGGAFEIHKNPANLRGTASGMARAIGEENPDVLDWRAFQPAGTSFVVRPYTSSPVRGRWQPQGDGTVTVTAGTSVGYETKLSMDGRMVRLGSISAYTYTNATGLVDSITFDKGSSIYSVYAGCYLSKADTGNNSQRKSARYQVRAVDYANSRIYLEDSLTTAILDGAAMNIVPPHEVPYLYWYVSTVTGTTPYVSVDSRVETKTDK